MTVAVALMRPPGRGEQLIWWLLPLAVSLFPIFWFTYPNLDDLSNHATRLGLELALLAGNRSPYYALEVAVAPNWALDALGPPIALLTGPLLATKVVLAAGCALVVGGVVALSRTLHMRWNSYPAIAALVANSQYVHFGLINYVFGVGLALCTAAGWARWSRTTQWYCWVGGLASSVLVYFAHLGGMLVLVLAVLALELSRAEGWAHRVRSGAFAVAWLGWLPLLLQLFVQRPGIDHTNQFPASVADFLATKAGLLWSMPTWYVDSTVALAGVSLFALLLCLYVPVRHGWVVVHPFAWWSAGLFGLAMLAVPRHGFGTMMLDIRIALPLGCCLLAGVSLRSEAAPAVSRLIAATVTAVALLLMGGLLAEWRGPDREQRLLRAELAALPREGRLAVVDVRGAARDIGWLSPHAASWYALDGDGLVSMLYLRPYVPFPLRFEPAARRAADLSRPLGDPAVARLCRDFDHVAVIGPTDAATRYAGPMLAAVYRSDHVLLAVPSPHCGGSSGATTSSP